MPDNISIVPVRKVPGLKFFSQKPDDDAVALRMPYRNHAGCCLALLLPVMFYLIAAKVAETGYFEEPINVILSAVMFLVVLALSAALFAVYMLQSTYLLIQPDWLFLSESGLGATRSAEVELSRISRIVREGVGTRAGQVAVVHDGEYTEVASGEHATVWLAKMLGAAANCPIDGKMEEGWEDWI
jgi:hypothetical protein